LRVNTGYVDESNLFLPTIIPWVDGLCYYEAPELGRYPFLEAVGTLYLEELPVGTCPITIPPVECDVTPFLWLLLELGRLPPPLGLIIAPTLPILLVDGGLLFPLVYALGLKRI
jgi:hypothetical protein